MQSEKSPLLGCEVAPPGAPPPPYSEVQSEIATFEGDFIRCEVCQYQIEKSAKKNKKVITCPRCNESTALGPPAKGKLFLRCPQCNCLLILRQGLLKTICPRSNCKATIDVKTKKALIKQQSSSSSSSRNVEHVESTTHYRIVCGRCHNTFIQDILPMNNKIRCVLCNKESTIGERGARRSAIMYIGIGMACNLACFALMISTMGIRHNSGYWYIYLILLLAGALLTLRGLLFLCMKHSTLEIANPDV